MKDEPFGVWDGRQQGWFRIDNAVLKTFAKDIGPTGFMVYCSLALHANQARAAWPSYATIAEQIGMSRRAVITAIQKLMECKLISRIESSTRGNMYRLNDVNELVQNLHQSDPASAKSALTSAKSATASANPPQQELDPLTRLNNKKGDKNVSAQKPQPAEPPTSRTDGLKPAEHIAAEGEGYKRARAAAEELRQRRWAKASLLPDKQQFALVGQLDLV